MLTGLSPATSSLFLASHLPRTVSTNRQSDPRFGIGDMLDREPRMTAPARALEQLPDSYTRTLSNAEVVVVRGLDTTMSDQQLAATARQLASQQLKGSASTVLYRDPAQPSDVLAVRGHGVPTVAKRVAPGRKLLATLNELPSSVMRALSPKRHVVMA